MTLAAAHYQPPLSLLVNQANPPSASARSSKSPTDDCDPTAISDSSVEVLPAAKAQKTKATGSAPRGSEKIRVTRERWVDKVVYLKELPAPCWPVPGPNEGAVAYVLDLQDDEREWKDSKGKLMSMATIIKAEVCRLQST